MKRNRTPYAADWRLWAAVAASLFTALILAALVSVLLSYERERTTADRLTIEQACMREYRSDLDHANAQVSRASSYLEILTSRGLLARTTGDTAAFDLLAAEAPSRWDELSAALNRQQQATREYGRAVDLARLDPEQFVEQCEARQDR